MRILDVTKLARLRVETLIAVVDVLGIFSTHKASQRFIRQQGLIFTVYGNGMASRPTFVLGANHDNPNILC